MLVVLVLCVAIFADGKRHAPALPVVPGGVHAPQCTVKLDHGADRMGNDIEQIVGLRSATECGNACCAFGGCVAFTFDPVLKGAIGSCPPGKSCCFLKNSPGHATPNAALTSGTVVVPAPRALWNHSTTRAVQSTPVVVDGRVIFGSDDFSVYCLDEKTGAFVWSFSTGGLVQSSPVVSERRVFVGSFSGDMYALDVQTGKKIWVFQTGNVIHSSPTVYNGLVIFGGADECLYAVQTASGDLAWKFSMGAPVDSSPVVAHDTVFIGSYNNALYALNISNGHQTWMYRTGGGVGTAPVVLNDTVVIASLDGYVHKVGAVNGSMVWKTRVSTGPDPMAGGPTLDLVHHTVIVNGDSLRSLRLSDGSMVWENRIQQSTTTPAWSEAGLVLVGGFSDGLSAYNATTGSLVWRFVCSSGCTAAPAIAGNTVLFGTRCLSFHAVTLLTQTGENSLTRTCNF